MSRQWSRSRNSCGLHCQRSDIAQACPARRVPLHCSPAFCAPLLHERTQRSERGDINLGTWLGLLLSGMGRFCSGKGDGSIHRVNTWGWC